MLCSLCTQEATAFCEIGTCAPGTWYCGYHYEQTHLPEDERDEAPEMYKCPYCGQYHPIGTKEFYCPLDPNKPKN